MEFQFYGLPSASVKKVYFTQRNFALLLMLKAQTQTRGPELSVGCQTERTDTEAKASMTGYRHDGEDEDGEDEKRSRKTDQRAEKATTAGELGGERRRRHTFLRAAGTVEMNQI